MFWHTIGAPRAAASAEYAARFRLPLDNVVKKGAGRVLLQTTVTELTPTEVVLHTGERIAYDYAVIATGARAPPPPRAALSSAPAQAPRTRPSSSSPTATRTWRTSS